MADSYSKDAMAFICEKYEIRRRIKTHGLRHTFASILLSRNVPLITVAEMLGDHPNTVGSIYAHSLIKKNQMQAILLMRL
ncbi:tyrosine-type recombinase/integrase [Solibacillus daqui]|uniref:tyrosine-type recombinase/integrase n=1 Tax=Solibacillus daqui TaxID=2912187 RepID=UPI003B75C7DF